MTVVFKLGGSLLTLDGLGEKLSQVLRLRSNEKRLLVVGGGPTADVVREWSQIHRLSDETAHWLAISSLELNEQLVQTIGRWKTVDSRERAREIWSREDEPVILNLQRFLKIEEMAAASISHDWTVTSDSLAAWTAVCWPADELILLKSVELPVGISVGEASRNKLVDQYFPQMAPQLRKLTWCNLRASEIKIDAWLEHEFA